MLYANAGVGERLEPLFTRLESVLPIWLSPSSVSCVELLCRKPNAKTPKPSKSAEISQAERNNSLPLPGEIRLASFMTKLIGKPDAGNPHVRFDEGE